MLERIQTPPSEQTEKLTLTRLVLWCKTQVWPEVKPILTDPKQKGALELTTSELQKLSRKPEWQRENCKKRKNWIYLLINSVQFLHLPSIGLSVVIHIQNYHCLHITNMYLEWKTTDHLPPSNDPNSIWVASSETLGTFPLPPFPLQFHCQVA